MADIPEESNVDTESNGVGLGEYGNDSETHGRGITIIMSLKFTLMGITTKMEIMLILTFQIKLNLMKRKTILKRLLRVANRKKR